jgi:hypothetical protein
MLFIFYPVFDSEVFSMSFNKPNASDDSNSSG